MEKNKKSIRKRKAVKMRFFCVKMSVKRGIRGLPNKIHFVLQNEYLAKKYREFLDAPFRLWHFVAVLGVGSL